MVKILTPVELIKKGDKVGSSEAALLIKLGIKSLPYRLVVLSIYDNGSVLSPKVLNLTEDDLVDEFTASVSMVASMPLAFSYPTLADQVEYLKDPRIVLPSPSGGSAFADILRNKALDGTNYVDWK
ncbi:60S acidic ribosomal protein P0-like [Asparagus officinalis]|uniref:60S acidic ribosomal protein P0-like n=1 Tax=Asparagus officinalis TaxID=4686 RepID=UPI00098E8628|nr:60S acidic ribosomal protein P0-like [Asparagus officinalis]